MKLLSLFSEPITLGLLLSFIGVILAAIGILLFFTGREKIIRKIRSLKGIFLKKTLSFETLSDFLKNDCIKLSRNLDEDLQGKKRAVILPLIPTKKLNLLHLMYLYTMADLQKRFEFTPIILYLDNVRRFGLKEDLSIPSKKEHIVDIEAINQEVKTYEAVFSYFTKPLDIPKSLRESKLLKKYPIEITNKHNRLIQILDLNMIIDHVSKYPGRNSVTLRDFLIFLWSPAIISLIQDKQMYDTIFLVNWEYNERVWSYILSRNFISHNGLRLLYFPTFQNKTGDTATIIDPSLPAIDDEEEVIAEKIRNINPENTILLQQIYYHILLKSFELIEIKGQKLISREEIISYLEENGREITPQNIYSAILDNINPSYLQEAVLKYCSRLFTSIGKITEKNSYSR